MAVNFGSPFYVVHGISPLHMLAGTECKDDEFATWLLENNADVNLKTKDGKTPIFMAAEMGNRDMSGLLLHHGANVNIPDVRRNSPLLAAVGKKHLALAEFLIRNNANINHRNNDKVSAISTATKNGDKEMCAMLLRYGVDPNILNRDNESPLHIAVRENSIGIAELLLKGRACPNKKAVRGITPLYLAVQRKHADRRMCELLLQYNADPDSADTDGTTPLHITVSRDMYRLTNLLLEHKANVNCRNKDGITPLYIASDIRDKSLCEQLLRHGADPDISDKDDNSPLYVSLRGRQSELSSKSDSSFIGRLQFMFHSLLLQYIPYYLYITVMIRLPRVFNHFLFILGFFFSSYLDDLAVAQVLLEWGANPNCVNKNGLTPLHVGVYRKSPKTIQLLTDFGADPCHRAEGHSSAAHFAMYEGKFDIFKMLLSRCTTVTDELFELSTSYAGGSYERLLVLHKHLIKFSFFGRDGFLPFQLDPDTIRFPEECKAELNKLKKEELGHFITISGYEILTFTTPELAVFLKRENLGKILRRRYWSKKFPIYGKLFRWKVDRAERRKKDCDKLEAILSEISSKLSKISIEKIIGYFNDCEVKRTIRLSEHYLYKQTCSVTSFFNAFSKISLRAMRLHK